MTLYCENENKTPFRKILGNEFILIGPSHDGALGRGHMKRGEG